MTSPEISVVLGSYNRSSFLKLTIESIREEVQSLPHEIVVVDGGSTDGSLEWLIQQKDILTIVQHNRGEWRGQPIQRHSWGYFMNLAFKSAQGKYVCMLSDDCLVIPGAIRNGYKLFEEKLKTGEKVGAIAFYYRDWPLQEKYHVCRTPSEYLYVNHGLYLNHALKDIGYADEENFQFYAADTDVCMRMRELGYSILASPDSYIEHYAHANLQVRSSNDALYNMDIEAQHRVWKKYMVDEETGQWRPSAIEEREYHDPANTVQKFKPLHLTNTGGIFKTFRHTHLHFCTSIGHTSVPKLLALNESLIRHSSLPFTFWVLCDGKLAYQIMKDLNLPNFHLVTMEEFEEEDAPLLEVKPNRNRFEYNCTLRPSWLLYLLRKQPEISILTYMDTDLYFFEDPKLLLSQMEENSVLLSEHRYSQNFQKEVWDPNEPGIYNAGWLAFKNDDRALTALNWWRERCLEWCYDYYEDGKYGEQRYLNDWIERFPGVEALSWLGANVAPWNMGDYAFSADEAGTILVNNEPLIFYHFHALQWDGEFSFKVAHGISAKRRQLTNAAYRLPQQLIDLVYKPYLFDLEKALAITSKYAAKDVTPHSILEEDPNSLFDYGNILFQLGRLETASRAFTLAAFLQFHQGRDIPTAKIFLQHALSALSPQIEASPSNEERISPPSKLYPMQVIDLLRGLKKSRFYRLMRRLGRWEALAKKIEEILALPEPQAYPQAIEILRVLRQTRAYRMIRLFGMWSALDTVIARETA